MNQSPINRFLLEANLRIASNPCVSPDFCLDWPALRAVLSANGPIKTWTKSAFETKAGSWTLLEHTATGDCAWRLELRSGATAPAALTDGVALAGGAHAYPASFKNLIALKNLIQEHNPASTIFPTAAQKLGQSTLGIGARFTTLHWPAVEWAMSALEIGVTANQNSIPRELVYDVDAMLSNKLDTVPFPFIGTNVPEGHQGQSVRGHEPRLRPVEAQDRLSSSRHCLELQRRPPADRRQVRRARRPARHGLRARELHHFRSLTRACPDQGRG